MGVIYFILKHVLVHMTLYLIPTKGLKIRNILSSYENFATWIFFKLLLVHTFGAYEKSYKIYVVVMGNKNFFLYHTWVIEQFSNIGMHSRWPMIIVGSSIKV